MIKKIKLNQKLQSLSFVANGQPYSSSCLTCLLFFPLKIKKKTISLTVLRTELSFFKKSVSRLAINSLH